MKISIGIIGFGRIAEVTHKGIIDSLPGVRLSAVYDMTPMRREVAEKLGITAYDSLENFLKHPGLTAITVATPSNSHRDIVIKALKSDKHVLVEKPMAMNSREAREMMATAKKYKKVLTIFHNRRYDPDYLTVKKVVQSGTLGRILAIESRLNGWGSGAGFGVPAFYQNWRNEKKWGGGALYDWGSHLLDQIHQLVDSPIVSIRANLQSGIFAKDCDDYAMGMIEFKNGICAQVEINYMTKYPLPRWRIIAEKGTLISELGDWNRLKIFDPKGNLERHIPVVRKDPKIIYQSFLNAILGKGKPAVEPESVLKTMQIIDAFFESSRTKKTVVF